MSDSPVRLSSLIEVVYNIGLPPDCVSLLIHYTNLLYNTINDDNLTGLSLITLHMCWTEECDCQDKYKLNIENIKIFGGY